VTLDLEAAAEEFAQELQQLLDAVLPSPEGIDPVSRQVVATIGQISDGRTSFALEIGTGSGDGAAVPIALLFGGERTAELLVQIRLIADSYAHYPAVSKSTFELRVKKNPILRLDFSKDHHTVPGCHWNVHAERGLATALLVRQPKRHSGEFSKVHIPVGGVRGRPCLEDFLQMLITEFNFDSVPGAMAAIEAGRVRWRKRQLAAMVRDDAEEAARVLGELGYVVTPPADGHREMRRDRLVRW
jgi:hypothetical protein